MKIKRTAILAALTLFLTFAIIASCGKSDKSEADSGGVGKTAASQSGTESGTQSGVTTDGGRTGKYGTFSSVDPDGAAVTGDILSGYKLTMINIWGTRCPYCIDEMPDLAKLNGDYADKGFQVVGIVSNIDSINGTVDEEDAKTVKSILEATGANYINMLTTLDVDGVFLDGVRAVPTTFFINENGDKVGKTYLGAKSYDDWAKIIDSLLGEAG